MKTIREIIQEIATEAYSDNLLPNRAAELLKNLAALYGNILDYIQKTELEYNKLLLKCLEEEKTANRAKILAETSKEYAEKAEAVNTAKVALELIRSLKYFLRAKEEEYRNGKYQ